MKLKKDQRWDGWPAIDEEYFDSLAANLTLRPEIPKQIHRLIKQMKSVLRFCYFDYELIGITNLLSVLAFETALNLKYQEMVPAEDQNAKISLFQLIKWGERENLFEEHIDSLHSLRKVRNMYAHPKDAMIFGIMGIHSTIKIIDLINGIYDSRIDYRIKRKRKTDRINRVLFHRSKEGLILQLEDLRLIVFDSRLILYNNLSSDPEYYFWIYPIFEIKEDATEVDEKKPIILHCKSIKFKKSSDGWKMVIGESTLTEIAGKEDKEKFRLWQEKLNSCKLPIKFAIDQRYNDLRRELMSDKIYKWAD